MPVKHSQTIRMPVLTCATVDSSVCVWVGRRLRGGRSTVEPAIPKILRPLELIEGQEKKVKKLLQIFSSRFSAHIEIQVKAGA
jgi:hypothetical protein